MAEIKKKDFVEIEYTGKIKDGGIIFDTTDSETAKKNNIFNEKFDYSPAIICIGENHVIKGLDEKIEGKEIKKEYEIQLRPEEAFGKKDAKLLRIVPANIFRKQNIVPMPGLQVGIDGLLGTIRTVSGGRVIVDFNHPLAGKEISYTIKINRIVDDEKEKIMSLIKNSLGLKNVEVDIKDDGATLNLEKDLPESIKKNIENKIKEIVNTKKVNFIVIKK